MSLLSELITLLSGCGIPSRRAFSQIKRRIPIW